MCVVLYLSADFELPVIPWNESAPAFGANEIREETLEKIRHLLPGSFTRELMTEEGCGCKFIDSELDPESHAEKLREQAPLISYLQSAVAVGDVDLLALWLGDEVSTPTLIDSGIEKLQSEILWHEIPSPLLVHLPRTHH